MGAPRFAVACSLNELSLWLIFCASLISSAPLPDVSRTTEAARTHAGKESVCCQSRLCDACCEPTRGSKKHPKSSQPVPRGTTVGAPARAARGGSAGALASTLDAAGAMSAALLCRFYQGKTFGVRCSVAENRKRSLFCETPHDCHVLTSLVGSEELPRRTGSTVVLPFILNRRDRKFKKLGVRV